MVVAAVVLVIVVVTLAKDQFAELDAIPTVSATPTSSAKRAPIVQLVVHRVPLAKKNRAKNTADFVDDLHTVRTDRQTD